METLSVERTQSQTALQKKEEILRGTLEEKRQQEMRISEMLIEKKGFEEALKKAGEMVDEKEKVIRYQKQLQLNYVQMYKRNKTLESEIELLNKTISELEKKQKELIEQQQQMQSQSSKSSSSSSGGSAKSRLQKTGSSVRARLFKMSLHSESQC